MVRRHQWLGVRKEDPVMTDQPKVTSDPIEPEPVWRGRMRMTRRRKKALAVIVTIVFCWAAYVGHILAGVLLFPVFILWNWAIPGLQTAQGDFETWRARHDTFSKGYSTGMVHGGKSAMGAASRDLDDQSLNKQ